VSRTIKSNNNRPDALASDFQWVAGLDHRCNLLVVADMHADTQTGNLVAAGGVNNSVSITPWEVSPFWRVPYEVLDIHRTMDSATRELHGKLFS
jgi:hypothetical protein